MVLRQINRSKTKVNRLTHCNPGTAAHPRPKLALDRCGKRAVHAGFDGGRLTSDAGLLLIRQVDHRLGLTQAVSDALADPRNPAYVTHQQRTLIAQRVFALAAGHEDGDDHHQLRTDPALQVCCDQDPDERTPLASPATLSRIENRASHADAARVHEVLIEPFIASHKCPPEELVLDFDATDDRVHGMQEGRHFHVHDGGWIYLPLYVFCGEQLLVAYLRSADRDAARHSLPILKLLTDKLREAWPGVRIVFRGDAGFCRWKLHRWCDRHGVFYVTGLQTNVKLKRIAEPEVKAAESECEATKLKQRRFSSFAYRAGPWDRERTVVAKAEHHEGRANLRFVVTNLPGVQADPQDLYDRWYCQRGEMENRIKEQQLGLFADRTSCSTMRANPFRLLLWSVAYVLMERLRSEVLVGTRLARAQCSTIRVKLLKIAARVEVSVRGVVVQLSESHPERGLFQRLLLESGAEWIRRASG